MRSIRQRINDWINSFSDDLEITPIPDDTQVPRTTGDIARFDRRAWERVNARLHRGRLEITEARQFGTAQQIAPDELNRENPVGWGRTLAEAYDVFLQGTNNPPITTTPMAQRMTNEKWLVNEAKDILAQHGNPEIFHTDLGITTERVIDYGINIMNATTGQSRPNYLTEQERRIYRACTNIMMQENINITLELPGTRTKNTAFNGTARIIASNDEDLHRAGFHQIRTKSNFQNHHGAPTDEIILATVHNNVIYLYFKLEERSAADKAILRYVLKKALELIPENEYPRQKPGNYEELAMIKAMTIFEKNRSGEIENQLAEAEKEAESALIEYINSTRQKADLQTALSLARNKTTNIEEKTTRLVQYLDKNKKVKEYKFESGEFTIIFTGLHISFQGDTIDLPDFTVKLNVSTGNFKASVQDPAYSNVAFPHPHIYDNGSFCLGDYTTTYARIVAQGEFIQVIELISQFLESYNNDSPTNRWSHYRYDMKHNQTSQRSREHSERANEEWDQYLQQNGRT